MRESHSMQAICLTVLGMLLCYGMAGAQEADDDAAAEAAENEGLPEIPDEPRTVDPATFISERLTEPVTVDFTDSSIGEVADWIREEHGFPVLIDEANLIEAGILIGDPVSDSLDGDPLYLLLDRLRLKGLAWYVEDDILQITTLDIADEHLVTTQYLVGDLLDAGHDEDELVAVIQNETAGPWFDLDGVGGTIVLLGDVMFVRQTDQMQHEVAGLLTALRDHARMTFTLDPPQNEALRQKLQQNVTADFENAALISATQNLAEQAEARIHLDTTALLDNGIRDRQPVSLTLADRPLHSVLSLLLSTVQLSYVIRDGAILVTTPEKAEELFKTAIYDVRDLCRDADESDALTDAIQQQTGGPWFDLDGIGGTISFAGPGAMVIRQTESELLTILDLLETYRAALRMSRPREREEIDMEEMMTWYYRVDSDVADDLEAHLPSLVRPESWLSDDAPEAEGTILRMTSTPSIQGAHIVSQAVLIIHQSRAAQQEISEVILRVQAGDTFAAGEFQGDMGGGGFGGGGFGGGYFSTD